MQMTVDHARDQARAQLAHILELLQAFDKAVMYEMSDVAEDQARELILQNALSVEVRGDWRSIGAQERLNDPVEFCILLCTGGPAVRILGGLDECCEPRDVRLQYQDWGTPWTDYPLDETAEAKLEAYCRHFYFGEG